MSEEHHAPYLKGRVVYQIYPRSFADSNCDGIGDIPGIIDHLDYLNNGKPGTMDSLGVNMIWLTPFYPSPMADFGYDIADYFDIHPMFGTLSDFRHLVRQSHKRGIKIMIDFVPNHTSNQHPWFEEARSSRNSAKRDWYIWRSPATHGGPPNNWLSVFGGSAWELDDYSQQYYMHSFLKEQPDLNWENPSVREAMMRVIRFWMDLGADGIRVDAVDWMGKDALFRDDPPNPRYSPGVDDPYHEISHIHSQKDPNLFGYLRQMAHVIKTYRYGFMVTETYPDRRNVIDEYMKLYKNYLAEVSAPFNFEGIKLPWSAKAFKTFIDRFQAALGPHHLPIYALGNHDNARLATRIGPKAARTAALMQLTLPGVAFVYYGDELGMTDVEVPVELIKDPFERRVPGLGLGRDPNRTPMQWNDSPHAGFSKVPPWLPIHHNYASMNVRKQSHDRRSTLWQYRKLIHLRNTSPILQYGDYHQVDNDNAYTFSYIREYKGRRLGVLLNFADSPERVRTPLGEGFLMYSAQLLREGGMIDLKDVLLPPLEGYIVALP